MGNPAMDGKDTYVRLPNTTLNKLGALRTDGRLGTRTAEQLRRCIVERVNTEYAAMMAEVPAPNAAPKASPKIAAKKGASK